LSQFFVIFAIFVVIPPCRSDDAYESFSHEQPRDFGLQARFVEVDGTTRQASSGNIALNNNKRA